MWKLPQGWTLLLVSHLSPAGQTRNELWQCPPVCPGSRGQQTGPALLDTAAEGTAGGAHIPTVHLTCATGNVKAVGIAQQADPKPTPQVYDLNSSNNST